VTPAWRVRPIASCLIAAALFGAATPASKALLSSVGAFALAGLLYLGAALATLPFVFRGGSLELARRRSNVLRLAGAVVFGGVVGPVLLLMGLARAPAATVALWLNLEGVATAVLGWALFREHLGGRAWLAVVLALAAGVLLATPVSLELAAPALLIALACVCWGLDNSCTALVDGFTPAQTTFVKGLVAGSFNLIMAFVFEPVSIEWTVALGALSVGALGYGASIVLYIHGAHELGATRSQVLFSTAPVVGVVLAWLSLGEPILPAQLLAMALFVPALWLLSGSRHEHEHAHPRVTHTHRHRHDDLHHGHEHDGPTPRGWHTHEHTHEPLVHEHAHAPDLHHRHDHGT
jgi:drug/metabolite transporter (DMT)-like permease